MNLVSCDKEAGHETSYLDNYYVHGYLEIYQSPRPLGLDMTLWSNFLLDNNNYVQGIPAWIGYLVDNSTM